MPQKGSTHSQRKQTKEQIIAKISALYIYELLFLCSGINQFENTPVLYEIAVDGDYKGIKAFGLDLHQLILSTLAFFNLSGDYEFWFKQIQEASNQSYALTSIYALIKHGYSLDIIFKGIGIFIDRFKDAANFVAGIRDLIKNYDKDKIINHFKAIEHKLSARQKDIGMIPDKFRI